MFSHQKYNQSYFDNCLLFYSDLTLTTTTQKEPSKHNEESEPFAYWHKVRIFTVRCRLEQEFIKSHFMYAPMSNYEQSDYYTVLRSPHIARNEEVLVKPMAAGEMREKYFSHLSYVIMVDSRSLIPERLGVAL